MKSVAPRVYDWHQQRGMAMGCDHGGRGRNVVEFGDYFRTQRWNQGPGADQPRLSKDLIKAKVASSIAHLYQRPRVWLEGFYGSGWGTTSAGLVDATFANYAMGFNLLGLHGMYYSTHGGWWEWAPPDNTFRMPYWRHLRGFMDCQQRLAYLLSQGDHRCDVAIMYPVAPMQAGMGGKEAVQAAFRTGQEIYAKGIDFDFMDFESLARAEVVGKELHVSGEIYRVLVLPAMRAVRHSTLLKAVALKRAGGIVLAVGALPKASDRMGRDDPELAAMVEELFSNGPASDVAAAIPLRDYIGPGYVMHRRIGPRDLYAIYNAPQGTECLFRATGRAELWDPWTGTTRPLPVLSQDASGTKLEMPLTEKEMQLIVFSPGQGKIARSEISDLKSSIPLDGEWEFELAPSLDNRFGDFHWPPTKELIGAEARRLKYADETSANPGWQDPKLDDSEWATVTCGFGPCFWQLGPLPNTADADAALAALRHVDPAVPVQIGATDYRWQPYEFSWRFGMQNDCAHQGYHGLKEQVADEFIGLGTIRHGHPSCRREAEMAGTRYYLWSSVHAATSGMVPISRGGLLPSKAWLNGKLLDVTAGSATVSAGANPLLLRFDQVGRGYFVVGVDDADSTVIPPVGTSQVLPWNVELAMRWYHDESVLPFDARPQVAQPAGWYRFVSPPGLCGMTIPTRGRVRAWVDGKELGVEATPSNASVTIPDPSPAPAAVALRVEQIRGDYGGAAFDDYIRLDCGPGRLVLGDWAMAGVLETYSGGAWYRKSVALSGDQLKGRVALDLGNVAASADVRVNGKPAGIKVAPPWTLDITDLVKEGENRIEVLVRNTLANHYVTIPTHYRGQTVSGLLGPVAVRIALFRNR